MEKVKYAYRRKEINNWLKIEEVIMNTVKIVMLEGWSIKGKLDFQY